MVTKATQDCQTNEIDRELERIKNMVDDAVKQGRSAHELEREVFAGVCGLGRMLFAAFLKVQVDADLGPSVTLPDGRRLVRCLPQQRRLMTLFGEFKVKRAVYAVREGQVAEVIPFDQRLALPESDYSYPLQDWCQTLAVELAFKPVTAMLKKFMGIRVTVDTVERICQRSAELVEAFQDSRPAPSQDDEGEILVATIDHKGIPMVRTEAIEAEPHRTKGKKPKKRMAAIGCTYSVDPHIRTPEELTSLLFCEASYVTPPPEPQARRYWASLSRDVAGVSLYGQDEVLKKMAQDIAERRQPGQILVYLTDGQRSLVTGGQAHLPRDAETVEILDLLHVTPRLWEAAHLFHKEGSTDATVFVRRLLARVLHGETVVVVSSLRQMATKRRLRASAQDRLRIVCEFLLSNLHRMRYHEYLAQGYPIATGVIEGACRHIIKDRMERTGMRWKPSGAHAVLQLRTTKANDCWDEFHAFRIEHETLRKYPYQNLLSHVGWPVAA